MNAPVDAVIVGAGFYGLRIALFLREQLGARSVTVIDKESAPMERSSYVNQARVHNGYHYPRSILTAYRSRVNFPDFSREFSDAVVDTFDHYYAIAAKGSKLSARQFEIFCDRIGAAWSPAPPRIASLFNPYTVESSYRVTEPAFNSRVLRQILLARIEAVGGIDIRLGEEALSIAEAGEVLEVTTSRGDHRARRVISAVYSRINQLHRDSTLPQVALQHEITEMALVALPGPLDGIGVTVMDGPFFSIMPFPSRGLHTLSHVRYTPQHRWKESAGVHEVDAHAVMDTTPKTTRFPQMYSDVIRYIPSMRSMRHEDSIWEVKTVLQKSDGDDSRPILYRPDHGIKNYTCIMGGKLDNIYDVLEELSLNHAHQ